MRIALTMALFVCSVALPARAEKVYVNGVEVTGLTNARLEGATVEFDAQGNVLITAPGYRVQAIDDGRPPATGGGGAGGSGTTGSVGSAPSGSGGATPVYSDTGRVMYTEPSGQNAPLTRTTTTTTTTTGSGGTTTTTTGGGTPAASPPPPATLPPPSDPPVRPDGAPTPTLRYFLVTQGTQGAAVGETVQLNINGRRVRDVDSAGAQVIVEVTAWLNPGPNTVTLLSTKKAGYTPGPSTSTFQVFVGEAHVEAGGRVVMDRPLVTYTRTAADASADSRTFTLDAR